MPVHRVLNSKESLSTLSYVHKGGTWRPTDCQPSQQIAIIVPYRNRTEHLKKFLRYIHWFLQWQKVDYRVVIVQQTGSAMFNRGMLMNIGFNEARTLQRIHCAIFHDVDLLPENDKNLYRCGSAPKHMSVAVSSFSYKLPYTNLFGGVEAFQTDQFLRINGFSNLYFGWGGEDDDLYKRVYLHRMEVKRDRGEVAKYYMLNHDIQPKNPERYNLLKSSTSRFETDGLNSLVYKCVTMEERPLFTWILVNIDHMLSVQL